MLFLFPSLETAEKQVLQWKKKGWGRGVGKNRHTESTAHLLFSANLWGWQDKTLTMSKRLKISILHTVEMSLPHPQKEVSDKIGSLKLQCFCLNALSYSSANRKKREHQVNFSSCEHFKLTSTFIYTWVGRKRQKATYPLTSSTAIKSLPSPLLKRMKPSAEVVLNWKKRCMDV